MVRGGIEQLHRLPNGIANGSHPLHKWRPPPTAFRAVIPFALQPRHRHLLCCLPRRPPGRKRIDHDITGLVGTTKSEGQLTASCLHHPTGHVLFLPASVLITCAVLTPGEAAAGHIAALHRRFASDAHAFARVRCCRFLVFFSMLANIAAVWAIFFGGLAVTTLRSQKPIRLRTSAMGRGEGNGSSPEPWARQAARAAWAGSRVEARGVRNVGACCACAAASRR